MAPYLSTPLRTVYVDRDVPAPEPPVPMSPAVSETRRGPGRPAGSPNKRSKPDTPLKTLGNQWQAVGEMVSDFLEKVHALSRNRVFNLQVANYRVRTNRDAYRYDLHAAVRKALAPPSEARVVGQRADGQADMLNVFYWELNAMVKMVEALTGHCIKVGNRIFEACESEERGIPIVRMTAHSVMAFKSATSWSKCTLYRVDELEAYLTTVRMRQQDAPWYHHLKKQLLGSEVFFLDVVPTVKLDVDYDTRGPRSSTLSGTSFNAMLPPLLPSHLPKVQMMMREQRYPRLVLSLIWYIFCDQPGEFLLIVGFLSLVLKGIKRPDALLNVVGSEGCGKTLLFYHLMVAILGKANCSILQSINAVYGRFNTHKVGKMLVVNDDALPKALSGVSHMGGGDGNKSTTTGDVIAVEAKGRDIEQVSNVASEINLSNHFSNSLLGERGRRLKTVIGGSLVNHADLGLDTIMFWRWAHEAVIEEAERMAAYLYLIPTEEAYEFVVQANVNTVQNVAELVYTKSRTERELMHWVQTSDFGGYGWPCDNFGPGSAKPIRFDQLYGRFSKTLDVDFMEFRAKIVEMCGRLVIVSDDADCFTVLDHDSWYRSNGKLEPIQYVLLHRDAIVFDRVKERRMIRLRTDCGLPSTGPLDEDQVKLCRARLIGRLPEGYGGLSFRPKYPAVFGGLLENYNDADEFSDISMPFRNSTELTAASIISNNAGNMAILIDD